MGPINNIPAFVKIMAWRRPGDKPLSEPMMVILPTHICVTRPQCVKVPVQNVYKTYTWFVRNVQMVQLLTGLGQQCALFKLQTWKCFLQCSSGYQSYDLRYFFIKPRLATSHEILQRFKNNHFMKRNMSESPMTVTTWIQYIPRNMHTVLLCFALLWLCNRS